MTQTLDDIAARAKALEGQWVKVPDYELYFVNRFGEVKSSGGKRGDRIFLKQHINMRGYKQVALYNAKTKKFNSTVVHKLVHEAFGGKSPTSAHVVSHINDIKTDNRAENLEWATSAENSKRALENKRYLDGHNHPMAILTEQQRRYICKHYKRTAHNKSNAKFLSLKFGVTSAAITAVVKRARKLEAEFQEKWK